MRQRPKIIIVGAGFAGLQTAVSLGGAAAEVCLIDRHPYHTFVPLLYQVATATLLPEQVAFPVRSLCRRHKNLRFLQTGVQKIDLENRRVHTDRVILNYDYLVLATGSQLNFYGVKGAKDFAKPLRTLEDAIRLRNHLLQCFEQAVWEKDRAVRQQLLTFAIVGGGATGVELAGALSELIQSTLLNDYPELAEDSIRVCLLHSGDQLMREFIPRLGRYTAKVLKRMGVEVLTGVRATEVTVNQVRLDNGQQIETATVIWTAGVEGHLPNSLQTLLFSPQQQLKIKPTLQLRTHPEVYAIGDVAEVRSRGHPLSGVAPEALQQGVATAKNLRRQLSSRPLKPFHYFNKGRLAIIGGYAGIGKIGPFQLSGFLPWILWLGVHLVYLPGYLSRFQVLLTWLNAYLWGDGRRPVVDHRTVRQKVGASRKLH